ncbi:MAG: hypothetical protein H6672_20450 [Anaerolineaceae bacterium]|nr:hypothetical protein [Anaerolineaceae bacterium]
MIQISLNAIFAYVSLRLAWLAWGRAVPFVRAGWQTIHAEVRHADYRYHIERRRAISVGGGFLVGGLLWAGVSVAAAGFGLFFVVQVVRALVVT